MNDKNNFYSNHPALIIILFSMSFSLIFSNKIFIYPSAVTLKNGNILVIHQTGVTICNSSYTSPFLTYNDVQFFLLTLNQFQNGDFRLRQSKNFFSFNSLSFSGFLRFLFLSPICMTY